MANFVTRKKVLTKTPNLRVDAGLPVGVHHFQLVLLYTDGSRSDPFDIHVKITRSEICADDSLLNNENHGVKKKEIIDVLFFPVALLTRVLRRLIQALRD